MNKVKYDKEPTSWVTRNGVRIPLFAKEKGNSKKLDKAKLKNRLNKNRNHKKSILTKKEMAEVTHAINYDCNIYRKGSKYEIGGVYSKAYGDFIYKFEIKDFNDYNFISKKKIKGN